MSRKSASGVKTGYCRRVQNPFPGCGAKAPRQLAPVKLGPRAKLWLCRRCMKRHGLPWPGEEVS